MTASEVHVMDGCDCEKLNGRSLMNCTSACFARRFLS